MTMLKFLLFIVLTIVCIGCASPFSALVSPALYAPPPSPYQVHEKEIEALYASGKISPEKYLELKQGLLVAKQQQAYQEQQTQRAYENNQPKPKSELEQIKEQQEMVRIMSGQKQRIATDCVVNGNHVSCN